AVLEAIHHRQIGEGCALCEYGIGAVENDGFGRLIARCHLAQHPGGCDATLGCLQHEYLVEIALAVKLVCGPGESPFTAIPIVERREIVERDQRDACHCRTDTLVALEDDRHQTILPAMALSTQRSVLASDGW